MTAQRCMAPGCGRFVRAGAGYCTRQDGVSEQRPKASDADAAHARFLERLEQGRYEGLFDTQIREVMIQAATAMREQGLSEEIGALRYVLARLLNEEKGERPDAADGERGADRECRRRGRSGRSAGTRRRG